MSSSKYLLVLTLVCLCTAEAIAAQNPVDFRRTLFVTAAQKELVLEAPKNMCFIDKSSRTEKMLFDDFAGIVEQDGDQALLAVFVDCTNLANLGGKFGATDLQLNAGTISWMNPAIGAVTPLGRKDYLDTRAATFQNDAAADAPSSFHPEDKIHRTDSNVSLGLTGTVRGEFQDLPSAAVVAATSVQHVPLQIMIRTTGKDLKSLENIYPLMDKLTAQEIALNE